MTGTLLKQISVPCLDKDDFIYIHETSGRKFVLRFLVLCFACIDRQKSFSRVTTIPNLTKIKRFHTFENF